MSWDRIRGHAAVRAQFQAAHERGRLAHAYLFVGPRGVGKHLTAIELTKALLCERPPAPLSACDRCPACALVAAGTHPDVFTVRTPEDKQSLPVESMRDFCSQFGLKAVRGTRKVGIIEDADDFNDESANCFLKTLEEPPPGSVLILLASSVETQLATIRSRCQIVRFHPLTSADLTAVLADHDVTDTARVEKLIRLSGGSPGQALALSHDALWSFRETLLTAICAAKPDPGNLGRLWVRFIEEVGKDSRAQRERAVLTIRLLMEPLRAAVRLAVGGEVETADPGESELLRRLAGRTGPDRLADLLEACTYAEYLIDDRKVQVPVVIEQLADELARSPTSTG